MGRWTRPLLVATLAASMILVLVAPLLAMQDAGGAGGSGAAEVVAATQMGAALAAGATPVCVSASRPEVARRVQRAMSQALQGGGGTISAAVQDARTGVRCSLSETQRFDSASVVKVTVMGAVLRRAQDEGNRSLTWSEQDLMRAMVTRSDNDATTTLWQELGQARIRGFLALAGMPEVQLDPSGRWGLTQISARDQTRLLTVLTTPNDVLNPVARRVGLDLMSQVVADQHWGVSAGAPAGSTVRLKNGWLPRATHGWRVHSIGSVAGPGHDYLLAVLTQDNAAMHDGIARIEGLSRAIHQSLAG